MSDQEFLHDLVSTRGIVMQIDRMSGVRLNIGFKSLRRWESTGHAGWDRTPHHSRAGSTRRAVAATEDEVLICGRVSE